MFLDFFKQQPEPDFVYDQAVIIDVTLEGISDFGTKAQRSELDKLQEQISRVLPEKAGIDGDEIGDGVCTIYVYGPSADKIFSNIEHILKKSLFNHIEITLQYGRAENLETKDRSFTL